MAAKKTNAKKKGVEAFEEELDDEELAALEDLEDDEEDDEDDADGDESDDESDDDDDEVDDDGDEEDDEAEEDPNAFKPFIIHEDQEWELNEIVGAADNGEIIIFYDLDTGRWYKLLPIKVGEVPTEG